MNIIRRLYSGAIPKMKILVFDTETTGLPKYRNASIFRTHDWPYVVQLSFMMYDAAQNEVLDVGDYLIKLPDGVEIEAGAQAVHGISKAKCDASGISMADAYRHFNAAAQQADVFVAHNLMFDKRLMMVEARRLGIAHPFGEKGAWKPEFCTMKETTDMCKIEVKSEKTGETYYKYPKLAELHRHLFNYVPEGLHDSLADILCCLRCYMQLCYGRDVIYDCRRLAAMWREKCIGGDVIIFS